ncbi:Salutaridinol 7-O-acetyltransferase [Linum grandiflorum]
MTNAFRLAVPTRCRYICTNSETALVVKVTSRSLVKPSTPTPPKFRHYKLSLLDQLLPSPLYPTYVLFYPINNTPPLWLLRDSLSKTLSHFYPFAGRIKDIKEECNDQGVEYIEAEANQEIKHFLSSSPAPNTQLLGRLAPPRRPQLSIDMPLACVQTTMFRCGGMAVGVSLNHFIADGYAFKTLLNHWANVARGDAYMLSVTNIYAHNMAASLFPINEAVFNSKLLAWRKLLELSKNVEMPVTVSKRFVFKHEDISTLKNIVKSNQVPNPSRSLAISGLIWKTAMKAYISSSGQTKTTSSSALTLVDLRPRFKTFLPDYCIGNLLWAAEARSEEIQVETLLSHDNDELKRLTYQLKRSIDKVDTKFVENLKGEKGNNEVRKYLESRGLGSKGYFISSVLRSELNKIDFGWGKPIWVSFIGPANVPLPDSIVLMEATPNDGRVEVLVSLTEKEMDIFQEDPQLLQYATINPRVL